MKIEELRKQYFCEFGKYSSNCDHNFPQRRTDGHNHVSYTKDWPSGFELNAQIAPKKNEITAYICIRSTRMPTAYDSLHESDSKIQEIICKELGELINEVKWSRGIEGKLRITKGANVSEQSNWPDIFKHHLRMLQALRNVLLPMAHDLKENESYQQAPRPA